MADEAVPVEGTRQTSNLRTFTIADKPTVAKFSLMQLSGDNTASFSAAGSGAFFAGILIAEKEGEDGATTVTLDTGGVYDLTASGAIPRGHRVMLGGGNRVVSVDLTTAALAASGGLVVGVVTETASNSEIVRVDLSKKS